MDQPDSYGKKCKYSVKNGLFVDCSADSCPHEINCDDTKERMPTGKIRISRGKTAICLRDGDLEGLI